MSDPVRIPMWTCSACGNYAYWNAVADQGVVMWLSVCCIAPSNDELAPMEEPMSEPERCDYDVEYRHALAMWTDWAARAERAEAAVIRVRELHLPFRIYQQCGHVHTATEVEAGTVKNVDDVGYVCDAGFMYAICRECCLDGGDYQTEGCATTHDHPLVQCETLAALDEVVQP